MTLLEVQDLQTRFRTDEGPVQAVDGVSFTVDRGEVVCLVGETGSGKTAACESITRLAPKASIDGEIRFDDRELTALSDRALRTVRGDRIAHVFQQPGTALDPVYTVGDQIVEAIRIHRDVPRGAARDRAVELLDQVGIAAPSDRLDAYPHELSGGMRQRVAIAIALAADPELLIADEPTTKLDVTIQAQVLDLLGRLQADRDLAVLLVTHDLGVVAEVADRVVVLYDGKVMERGPVRAVFADPAHPYTQALFAALEGVDTPGSDAGPAPDGCRFRAECPYAIDACAGGPQPPLYPVADGADRTASCVYYDDERDASVVRQPSGGDAA